MVRGTMLPINKALMRPFMLAGVEKRLALGNALLSFPLVASTHLQLPACLLGIGFFMALHVVLVFVTKHDPHVGKLFQRSTRYALRSYFPAKSHPLMLDIWHREYKKNCV